MTQNPNNIGQITETQVILHCLLNQISVSIPYGDKSRYDLILDINHKLYRVQIKTSRRAQTQGEAFMFNCYSIVNGKRHKYTKDEIDFFATIWNNELYLIPVEECSTEKTLWIDVPTQSTCCLASKYTFKEVLSIN